MDNRQCDKAVRKIVVVLRRLIVGWSRRKRVSETKKGAVPEEFGKKVRLNEVVVMRSYPGVPALAKEARSIEF